MSRSGIACSKTLDGEVQHYVEEIQHGLVNATVLTIRAGVLISHS